MNPSSQGIAASRILRALQYLNQCFQNASVGVKFGVYAIAVAVVLSLSTPSREPVYSAQAAEGAEQGFMGAIEGLYRQVVGTRLGQPQKIAEVNTDEVLKGVVSAIERIFQDNLNLFPSPASGAKIVGWCLLIGFVFIWLQLPLAGKDITWGIAESLKLSTLAGFAVFCFAPRPEWSAIVGHETLGKALHEWFKALAKVDGSGPVVAAAGRWGAAVFTLMGAKILPEGAGIAYVIVNLVPIIGSLIMLTLAVLALCVAAVVTIGHYLMGHLLITLAIAAGPMLVPGLMFKPLNFLFDAWLKTILNGGMMLFIGNIFIAAGQKFAEKVDSLVQTLAAQNTIFEAYSIMTFYGAVFLGTLIFVMIAGKLDNFARTLISGSGVSGFSMGSFRDAVSATGAAPKMAGAASSRAANAAGATREANRQMQGAMSAYKAETKGADMSKADRQAMRGEMAAAARSAGGFPGGSAQRAAARRAGEQFVKSKLAAEKAASSPAAAPSTPLPKIPRT